MTTPRWMIELLRGLGMHRAASGRARSVGCADCPIVMQCGREPQEHCLARLEALAGGRRRQLGPWDTARFGHLM